MASRGGYLKKIDALKKKAKKLGVFKIESFPSSSKTSPDRKLNQIGNCLKLVAKLQKEEKRCTCK